MARRRYSSRAVQRLALGSIAVAGMGLAGCDSPPEGPQAFRSVAECTQAGFDMQVCEAEYQQALARHAKDAPRFDSRAVCEAQYGADRCNEVTGTTSSGQQQSFFVPFLTGYLVSSALRDFSYGRYYDYRRDQRYTGPGTIYRDRSGRDVTTVRDGGRTVTRPLNRNTRTVSRRGFGGRGFGRGWGG